MLPLLLLAVAVSVVVVVVMVIILSSSGRRRHGYHVLAVSITFISITVVVVVVVPVVRFVVPCCRCLSFRLCLGRRPSLPLSLFAAAVVVFVCRRVVSSLPRPPPFVACLSSSVSVVAGVGGWLPGLRLRELLTRRRSRRRRSRCLRLRRRLPFIALSSLSLSSSVSSSSSLYCHRRH
jgi:hypothetical protein